jgi:glycerol-3-phosphate dehydrogenase subunit B
MTQRWAMLDLLVIGAGLTGLTAAYTAARAGLQVRVVAKGLGATHWSAGTVDVLGYHPLDAPDPVAYPFQAIGALLDAQPDHPYGVVAAEQRTAAVEGFRRLAGETGLAYLGAEGEADNLLLPSPVGAARPAFLAPQAQAAGRLGSGGRLLIVGFEGLRDFYPQLIAANLNRLGYTARAAVLPIDVVTDRSDFNTVQLATGLDQSARRRASLGAALHRLVEPGDRVGLPAILGLDYHPATLADIQARAGATVFEIPTLPPSVPGIRLHRAICRRLEELGVRVQTGMEAIDFGAENERIAWVATASSARPLRHRAANFLLATGGILGGGFDSDHTGRVWEVVFDLPLTVPQERSQWFRARFLDPAGQPVYQGGVQVNGEFRPVDAAGDPVFENLRAAGGLLAHADPIHERSREGIAIVTGVAAAQRILDAVRQPA